MILILTYGKVLSLTLRQALGVRYPGQVFYSHGLSARWQPILQRFLTESTADTRALRLAFADNQAIAERLARGEGRPLHLIVGVRDPIGRGLSAALQAWPTLFPQRLQGDSDRVATALAADLAAAWQADPWDEAAPAAELLARRAMQTPRLWPPLELTQGFGFAPPTPDRFDPARGWCVLQGQDARLLLYRQERCPKAVVEGVQALLGGPPLRLRPANVTAAKGGGALAAAVAARFRLPADFLRTLYADPWVAPFLTAEERAAALAQWQA